MLYTCMKKDVKKQWQENQFTGGAVEELSVIVLESTVAKGQSKVTIEISFADSREAQRWSVGKTYELPIPG